MSYVIFVVIVVVVAVSAGANSNMLKGSSTKKISIA